MERLWNIILDEIEEQGCVESALAMVFVILVLALGLVGIFMMIKTLP